NSRHDVRGHPQLRRKAVQRFGGIESHFGVDTARRRRWIEFTPLGVGNDDEAAIGLESVRNRPENLLVVKNVDIVVDNHYMLEQHVCGKSRTDRILRLAGCPLIDRYVSMKATVAGDWETDIFDRRYRLPERL